MSRKDIIIPKGSFVGTFLVVSEYCEILDIFKKNVGNFYSAEAGLNEIKFPSFLSEIKTFSK